MYWHEVWLQMDGLGVTMCSSSPLCAFSSSLCFPLKLCLTSLLPFPFMFPPLAWSITHWCWFYDLFLWSLSLPLCLSHSESLLVCCWDGRADWMWFILTPESVLWLAQSWHADTHTSWHMRLRTHTHTYIHSSLSCPEFILLAGMLPQIPDRSQNRHRTHLSCSAVMWLDMADIDCAFLQISMSLSVTLPVTEGFAWFLWKAVACKDWYNCLHGCEYGSVKKCHTCVFWHTHTVCDCVFVCFSPVKGIYVQPLPATHVEPINRLKKKKKPKG